MTDTRDDSAPSTPPPGTEASEAASEQASPADQEAQTDEDVEEIPEAEVIEIPREDELEAELAKAKSEAADFKDRWLRAVAEHENYKKRTARDAADQVQRSVQRLLSDILPVADNLDRALEAAPDRDDQLVTGIKMVRQVLNQGLEKNGITPVPGVGEPFDPNFHEALQQFDSPDYAPGRITQIFEGGYLRDGRLLRPAKVIVAGPGSTGSAPEEAGADANGEVSDDVAEEV